VRHTKAPSGPRSGGSRSLILLGAGLAIIVLLALVALLYTSSTTSTGGKTSLGPAPPRSAPAPYRDRGRWPAAPPPRGQTAAPARPAITGYAYDLGGRPIPGVLVTAAAFEQAGNIPSTAGTAQTDPSGRFDMPLPEGTYQLNAAKEGYGPTSTIARTFESVSLILPRSGAITGTVYDEQRRPIDDFVIDVISVTPANMPAPAPVWSRRFQGTAGAYRADQIPAWPVLVRASAQGRAPAFSEPLRVAAEQVQRLDLTLAPGCALTGTVRTRGGEPVPYVLLTAEARLIAGSASGLSAASGNQTQSDEQGRFRLEQVPLGAVLVRAYDGAHAVTTQVVDVRSCEQTAPLTVVLSEGGGVGGVARDSEGRPIPGARLSISHRSIGFVAARADEEGRFLFSRLPPGKARLELHHEGQRALAIATIREGEVTQKDMTIFASGKGEIRGRVTAGGRPVPHARLIIGCNHPKSGIATYYPVAAEDGSYRVTGLPEGHYIVHVSSSSSSGRVRLQPGEVATLDLDVAAPKKRRAPTSPDQDAPGAPGSEEEPRAKQEPRQQAPVFSGEPRQRPRREARQAALPVPAPQ
jgi:hypothetical protein